MYMDCLPPVNSQPVSHPGWWVDTFLNGWVGVHYPSIFKYTVYSTYLILASKKRNQIILFFVSRLKNQLAHRIIGFWGPRHGVLRLQELEGFIAQSCFRLHRAFRRHKNKDKHMEHDGTYDRHHQPFGFRDITHNMYRGHNLGSLWAQASS